ncbi:TPA: S-type pyocin domain-containing protein [Vibrio parahaemolyticus]|nr:S-type pyocin domain-containing protein [Vibrio parahaemolyticus]
MSYKVVSLTNLMAHEFGQTEADFHYLSGSDLSSVLSNRRLSLEQLKEKLRGGHLVLLSSSPSIPLLVHEEDDVGVLAWRVSEAATSRVTPVAQRALNARAQLAGQVYPMFTPGLSPSPPMPEYRPEPLVPLESEKKLPLNYEYCFDMACSIDTLRNVVRLGYMLGSTDNEPKIPNWKDNYLTSDRTRIQLLGRVDEPKRLHIHEAGRSLSLSAPLLVNMQRRGANVVSEGFLPIQPAVQLGMRLGLPTEGFLYHFHGTTLLQEYRILGEGKWWFYVTMTYAYGQRLDPEPRFDGIANTILVYWKLDGQIVDDQYLVHLDKQITREELGELDEAWLQTHGVKLDIPALLDVVHEDVLPREEKVEPKPEPYNTHQVLIDPETGQRETWMKIAEQYDLTPRNLLDMNVQFNSDTKQPTDLKAGDVLNVDARLLSQTPSKTVDVRAFPPQPPSVNNAPLNSYYDYTGGFIDGSTVVPMRKTFVIPDVPVVRVRDMTPYKVFAKSCTQPEGCIDAGQDEESISNFGPWAFFFAQANANLAALAVPAIEATQAQMAITASQSAVAGTPNGEIGATSTQLNHVTGTLKDKLIDGYRWQVEGIASLFALQQTLFDDDTQYTDADMRALGQVQSRVRVHITEPEAGNQYPVVRAYHIDDTRIPVKYVEVEDYQQYSVVLDEASGAKIYWTPTDSGDASWQTTPGHDDGFEQDDILVTPIHQDGTNATVTPMPEEQDWRDAILVFPENSGIAPLYVVYKDSPRDKPGVVSGQGKDVPWEDGYWLGKAANEGEGQYIPTHIADALRGREFKRFSDLQTAIWKEVAKDPNLISQFDQRAQKIIQNGDAPFCRAKDQVGKRGRFELHHIIQIQHGGDVYNIDNLRINTVKNHIRIHSNEK